MSDESLLITAYQFIQIGETQTAERLLTGLIRREPRSEAAWLLLAACKHLPEEKEKCLEFVVEINPENGPALLALGEVLAGQDADALILSAFEDWQASEAQAAAAAALAPADEPEETREMIPDPAAEEKPPVPGKRLRTIWLWLAILVLAASQVLSWMRIQELEQALVAAQVRVQSLQSILTEYIVQIELLQGLLP
jgi:hypothetical protein